MDENNTNNEKLQRKLPRKGRSGFILKFSFVDLSKYK